MTFADEFMLGGAQNIKMKSKDDEGKDEKPKSGLAAGLKNLF